MYIESEDYRNLWQLAHEWAGNTPEKTDSNNLPKPVELNLKRLAAAILRISLAARTKNGAIFLEDSFFDYLFNSRHFFRLLKCRSGKSINRDYLESLYVRRPDFLDWCAKEKYPNSDFWVLTQVTEDHKINNRPKNELEDKAVCRAIASAYWDIDTNIHPTHLAESRAIQMYGNGRLYRDNTIKGWISDLDPLIKERKTGRPREVPYKINLETGALSEN